MAEFDGAIKKLFRKTPNLDNMPGPGPNVYTITLWDLPTWSEVDIVIDERLAVNPNTDFSTHTVLSSKPSKDGELWVRRKKIQSKTANKPKTSHTKNVFLLSFSI
jgi:hypothetical protein